MFFRASHFEGICDDDDVAKAVATKANSIIDKLGKVIFGNLFRDGSISNLSTTKEQKDTHVGIVIGIEEMGLFEDEREIHIDTSDADELVLLKSQHNEMLKHQNDELRKKLAKGCDK